MGIGAAVFLIAVGAILAFAVQDTTVGGVIDIHVVGWVLIVAGILGLVFTVAVFGRRRRTVVEQPTVPAYERRVVERPATTYERRVVERPATYERRVVDEGPDVL